MELTHETFAHLEPAQAVPQHVIEASNRIPQNVIETPQAVPVAWRHDCAALLTNDVELWINACPHCGKPRTAPPAIDDETRKMVLELCNTIINGSIYWTITLAKQIREKLEPQNATPKP